MTLPPTRNTRPRSRAWIVTALIAAMLCLPAPPALADADDIVGPSYFDRRTEASIDQALAFIAEAQRFDGSWPDKNPVAMTALSLIAFMVNGHLPGEGKYGQTIDRGIDYLLQSADQAGYMGTSMYAHGLATLALSEVWGMTDRDDQVKDVLKSAVNLILYAQNEEGGWRYYPRPQDADISVTAMQLVALASAKQAGVLVPDQSIDRAIRYVTMCYDPATGGFNYQPRPYSEPAFARSAAAVTAMMMCGEYDSEPVKGGTRYMLEQPEQKFQKTGHYAYAHYYAIQVMYRSGAEQYAQWYPQIRDALLSQMAESGAIGERSKGVYSTSMAVIVLGSPCHFVPAYQR
mgnify:FL=1